MWILLSGYLFLHTLQKCDIFGTALALKDWIDFDQ